MFQFIAVLNPRAFQRPSWRPRRWPGGSDPRRRRGDQWGLADQSAKQAEAVNTRGPSSTFCLCQRPGLLSQSGGLCRPRFGIEAPGPFSRHTHRRLIMRTVPHHLSVAIRLIIAFCTEVPVGRRSDLATDRPRHPAKDRPPVPQSRTRTHVHFELPVHSPVAAWSRCFVSDQRQRLAVKSMADRVWP